MRKGRAINHWIDFYLGIFLLKTFSLFVSKKKPPRPPFTKIVLVNLSSIGDSILSSVVTKGLAKTFAGAEIIYLASETNAQTASYLEGVDQVRKIGLKTILKLLLCRLGWEVDLTDRDLLEPDLVIDLSPWPRINALLAFSLNGKWTVGFAAEQQYKHMLFDLAVPHSKEKHEVENLYALLEGVLATFDRPLLPSLKPVLCYQSDQTSLCRIPAELTPRLKETYSQTSLDSLTRRFPELDFTNPSIFIFHPYPGGLKSQLKAWPPHYWVEVARFLAPDSLLLISGGTSDHKPAEELVSLLKAVHPLSYNLAGKLSLLEWAPLLKKADLLTVNTGFMHFAALFDCRMLAFHGPTNPKRWGPLSENSYVLRPTNAACCYLNHGFEYPRRPPACMEEISPEAVYLVLKNVWQVPDLRPMPLGSSVA